MRLETGAGSGFSLGFGHLTTGTLALAFVMGHMIPQAHGIGGQEWGSKRMDWGLSRVREPYMLNLMKREM